LSCTDGRSSRFFGPRSAAIGLAWYHSPELRRNNERELYPLGVRLSLEMW
jgi:hypothetical protein